MGQSRPLFVYFRSFLVTISIQIEKSIDGVPGIRTWGRSMVGADKTTATPVCIVYLEGACSSERRTRLNPRGAGADGIVSKQALLSCAK